MGQNPHTLKSRNNLAAAYHAARQYDKALPLFVATLKAVEAKLGADHPETLLGRNNLAQAYKAVGQLEKALPLFEQAAAGMEKRRFQHAYAKPIIDGTIVTYEQAGQFDKAEGWRRKWLAVVKEKSGAESPAYAGELAALGTNLLQQKKWADAETTLRESLAIREKKQPDAWTTFNTQSMLGAALLGQQKYADAEPLMHKGYEGLKTSENTIPPQGATRIPEAVDRLIEFYTATNKPDDVKKWKAERAKYPTKR